MPTLAETLAALKKRNEANAKTYETQNKANAMQFTPKQQQMIADKWYTQQSLLNKVVDVWQQKWLDWKKVLNQFNVATQWTNIPKSIDPTAEWNQIKVMENDRKWFVEPDDQLTDMINKTFPNLGDQLNKWYQTTFGVWTEIEKMLKDDLMNFQWAYWPDWVERKRLDEEIARQQQALWEEKQLLNVQYWLANSGIDANAAESWASGWQVAASKAAANKQALLQQAEYNDRLAKFGTDKLNQYQSMQDKLNTYMQTYIQNYGNSKDKYVIDNFNNLVNLQQNLAVQIKNLEAQNLARAADAANTAAIANAMWGKSTSANVPTWPWAVDNVPAWYYDWLTPWGSQTPNWSGIVWQTISPTNNDVWIPIAPQSLQSDWSYIPYAAWPASWIIYWQTDIPDRSYQKDLKQQEDEIRNTIRNTSVWMNTNTKKIADIDKELKNIEAEYWSNYKNTSYWALRYNRLISQRQQAAQIINDMNKAKNKAIADAKRLWIKI